MSSKTEAFQMCPKGSGEKVAAADMVGRYKAYSGCKTCSCEQQICSICGPCMCVCFFCGPIPFSGTPICPAGTNTWGNYQGYVELRHPLLPPPKTPISTAISPPPPPPPSPRASSFNHPSPPPARPGVSSSPGLFRSTTLVASHVCKRAGAACPGVPTLSPDALPDRHLTL